MLRRAVRPGRTWVEGRVGPGIHNATNDNDTGSSTGAGSSVSVDGLAAKVNLTGAEGTDALTVLGLGGDDTLDARTLPAGTTTLALDGGNDGLDGYLALAADARRLLAPGGRLIVELGAGQARPVNALFTHAGLIVPAAAQDLAATRSAPTVHL